MITLLVFSQIIFGEIVKEVKMRIKVVDEIFDNSSGRVKARVLIGNPEGLEFLKGHILWSYLEIPLPLPSLFASYRYFEVHPIITPWDTSSVSWFYPWKNPGGDLDTTSSEIYLIHRGVKGIPMTKYVIDFLSGKPRYGILIKPTKFEGEEFRVRLDELVNHLKNGVLRIYLIEEPVEGRMQSD